ncbi:ribosome silencing factor [Kocuria coralli]|uniref:Ribosomal silencing factor RsfS n=1 Tax=Kocuria coralli TaxID=1461025 RepID=A0A5J5KX73_9MICC|nr:ribosome silencing factor [Kocuria coralli]KAA9394008.1 ribosome silencing factor [Kocuria coralli]
MTLPETSLAYLRTAAKAADEKQAENIVALDVSEALGIVDSFLVASASNERLVGAIVDAIEEALIEEYDLRPVRREGKGEGRWVLLDYGDVIVHVQHDEDRAYYALERLWNESPVVDLGLQPKSPEENPAASGE